MKSKNLQKKEIFGIRPNVLVCLLLVVTTLAVYLQVWNCDFLYYDDEIYVTRNEYVSAGLSLEGLSWAFSTTHAEFWHPTTWLSHMLACQLFGLNPGWHHFTNLFFHIVSSLLLFSFFRKTTGDLWQSSLVAALFALHPLNVESVAWVAERKGVLCTFFWMLAMWGYGRYVERPGVVRFLTVVVSFVLGFMSKATIITLPFVLVLLDYWPLKRTKTEQSDTDNHFEKKSLHLIWEKIPFFSLAVLMGLMTYIAQQGGGKLSSLEALPLDSRIASAMLSYLCYIGKMLWPFNLSVFYPIRSIMPVWQVVGACVVLGTASAMVIVFRKKFPYLLVGWFWFLGTLVPMAQLVQVGLHSMADRYTYIPIVGLFIIVAWGIPDFLAQWRHKKLVLGAFAGVALSVLAVTTWVQTTYWKNSTTLFEHSSDIVPDNFVAYNILGRALEEQGRTSDAIIQYGNSLKIAPSYVDAHYNMGNALTKEKRMDEAIKHYKEALRIRPDFLKAHINLGNVLAENGMQSEAIQHYTEVLRMDNKYVHAHYNLGNILAEQGRMTDAAKHYMEALRREPDYANAHYNLANILIKQGNINEGIAHYTKALKINPEFLAARINLANVYAEQGNLAEAIRHYREVLLVDPDRAVVHYHLGNALGKQGKTAESIRHYQKALIIEPDFEEAHINIAVELEEQGRTDEALNHYNRVLRISPIFNAYVFYNMACIYATQNRVSESIDYLEKAIESGFNDWNLLQTDNDLENIRESRRFRAVIARSSKKP